MSTQIRFELPDPAYEAYTWLLQDEFIPAAQPPLLAGPDNPPGGQAIADPPRRLRINGYLYTRVGSTGPALFGQPTVPESIHDLTRWRADWLPQVETLAHQLESFDAATVQTGDWAAILDEQDREYQRIFVGVHQATERPAWVAVNRFIEAFAASFGEERRQDAMALLHGFPNRSLDRSLALWDLSRLVRADPGLASALDSRAQWPESTLALQFREEFGACLREFGHTNSKEMQDAPTWGEDPSIPLAVVRAYARQADDRSPREAVHRQSDRRQALERDLRGRAGTDPSVAALVPLMEIAQQLVPVLEDHNLLADQRIAAASRRRWLAIGHFLQQRGATAFPDDVFFYRRSELVHALEQGATLPQDELAQRRALHELCRATPPPALLGMPLALEQPLSDRNEAERHPSESLGPLVLRGAPASAGSYRGRARVVESFSDVSSLQGGDVLVCRSTTPPWTPYFAIIGALITNSGGILSHGAVVAREFGIPAVVGTRNATALIPDGATVTVDGTAGVVIVEA